MCIMYEGQKRNGMRCVYYVKAVNLVDISEMCVSVVDDPILGGESVTHPNFWVKFFNFL